MKTRISLGLGLLVMVALGLTLTQSALSTTPPLLQLIESDDPLVQRIGTWTTQDTLNASGGNYLYSSGSLDDALELHFTGTTIEIVYVTHPALGIFAIEIDHVVVRTVNAYSEETAFGVVSAVSYLADEPHVLRVYPASGVIAIDAFYTQLRAITPMLGEDIGPPNTTPILFYCNNAQNICLASDNPDHFAPPYVLTTPNMSSPIWSPDGRYILYADGGEVVLLGYTGQTWQELWRYQFPTITSISSLLWTPANHLIGPSCVDLNPVLAALASPPPPEPCVGLDYLSQIGPGAAFSPDGRYAVYKGPFVGDLYLYDITTATESLLWQAAPIESFSDPAWSPDSSQIVTVRRRTDMLEDLFVIQLSPLDGHAITPPTASASYHLRHPSWSPDGTRIVYESRRQNSWEINSPLNLHTSTLQVIALETGQISELGTGQDPAWKPRESFDFCVVQLNADEQYTYRSPSAAHTEHKAALLARPDGTPDYTYVALKFIAEDEVTPESKDQMLLMNTQLRLGNTYHYTKDIHNSVTDSAVMRILEYNLNLGDPASEWITPSDAAGDYDLWLYFHPGRFTILEGDCSDLEPYEVDDAYLSQIAPRHPAIEELRLFGIEPQDYGLRPPDENACNSWPNGTNCFIPRIWQATELIEVLQAAHDTAQAFQTVANFSGSSYQVFNRIMGDFTVIRLEMGYDSAGCISSNSSYSYFICTDNNRNAIGFWGDIAQRSMGFTRQLVVHEFGHRFDERVAERATALEGRVQRVSLRDDVGRLVMGVFLDDNGNRYWHRGYRGWGSGWHLDADNKPEISIYQQSNINTYSEAAADTFLNWVYRSFQNKTWHPNDVDVEGNSCNSIFTNGDYTGCLDNSNPGNARLNWIDSEAVNIFCWFENEIPESFCDNE